MAAPETAAAAPVFIELAGVQYRMGPLVKEDIAELNNWLRNQVISMARNSCRETGATDEEKKLIIAAAIEHAASLSWMSGRGARMMATIDGWSQILWTGIRKYHPEMTADKIQDALLDAETIDYIQSKFEEANQLSKNPPKRAVAKKKRRRKK